MEEQNKKLGHLKREEIKTMAKDLARLREKETEKERERVAKLKVEREIKEEREKKETARKEADERRRAEEEAKKRVEELAKSKVPKPERAGTPAESLGEERIKQKEKEEVRPSPRYDVEPQERLAEKLREIQLKEEQERKKFLERVARQAGETRPEGTTKAEESLPVEPEMLSKAPEKPLEPLKPPEPIKPPEIPKPPKSIVPKFPPRFPRVYIGKPSLLAKIWIRVTMTLLIFAILALVATFWYWFLAVRGETEKEKKEVEVVKEEIVIPPALISVDQTQTIQITDLSAMLQNDLGEDRFTRFLIQDAPESKIWSLQEFFAAFLIKAPQNFYDKIDDNFTLFVHSSGELKRMGFIAKIKEENLPALLSSWEPTMETDFANLFVFLGKDKPALMPYFKTGSHQGTNFRFQTFTRQDFGIVYTTFNDYFILTSSWESMKEILDKLKTGQSSLSPPFSSSQGAEFILNELSLEEKIGQLFLIGFDGKYLTPELKESIKALRPGGILLLKRNIENASQLKTLIQNLQDISLTETGLPLLVGIDQEGGVVKRIEFIEEKTAQSQIEEAFNVGLKRGEELKSLGINLNLAPVIDLVQSGDFLFNRSFQKNSEENGNLAKALISGQKEAGIFTAMKHFPGYGGISFNPEKELATLSEIPVISQFQKAAEANPEFIMTSNVIYSAIDSLPLTFSPKGIQFLKASLGDNYLIMTDDLPQNSLLNKFSLREIVVLPILAGVNILIFSGPKTVISEAMTTLYQAAQDKNIMEQINRAVLKIIQLKQKLSL